MHLEEALSLILGLYRDATGVIVKKKKIAVQIAVGKFYGNSPFRPK